VDAGWAEAGTGSFAKYNTDTVQCTICIQKLLLLLHDLHFFVSNMVYTHVSWGRLAIFEPHLQPVYTSNVKSTIFWDWKDPFCCFRSKKDRM
jgi:hypothetical protein